VKKERFKKPAHTPHQISTADRKRAKAGQSIPSEK